MSAARRTTIVEATLRVIGERGADAVTHRAVAAAGGVPLASTTYHFRSKEALVVEALELAIERSTQLAAEFSINPPTDPDGLVARLVQMSEAQLVDSRAPLAAQYELLLEAGRRPALRPLAQRWDEAYGACLATLVEAAGLPEEAVPILVNVLEGALLSQLSLPVPNFGRAVLHPMLDRVVVALHPISNTRHASAPNL